MSYAKKVPAIWKCVFIADEEVEEEEGTAGNYADSDLLLPNRVKTPTLKPVVKGSAQP